MIRGVLFDMDGVLFDTERLSIGIYRQVTAEMGFALPDALVQTVAGGNAAATQAAIKKALGPQLDYERLDSEVHRRMRQALDENGVPVKPGARELLSFLAAENIPAAVASSTRHATVQRMLAQTGFAKFFAALVGGDCVPRSKPAPDIFLAAAAALNLPAGACLALEDSPNGVRAAAAAGCVTVMVPDLIAPTPDLTALCTDVLPNLHQIIAFLQARRGAAGARLQAD